MQIRQQIRELYSRTAKLNLYVQTLEYPDQLRILEELRIIADLAAHIQSEFNGRP